MLVHVISLLIFYATLASNQGEVRAHLGKDVGSPAWRMCHVCSGQYPDRECELYPRLVSQGPGQVNCTRNFCTVYARFRPKQTTTSSAAADDGQPEKQLDSYAPSDFVVDSIARDCEDVSRGNTCDVDVDGQGITCYVTCLTSFCNNITRRPTESDIKGAGTGSDVTGTPLTALDHVTRDADDSSSSSDEERDEKAADSHPHHRHHGNRGHGNTMSPDDGAKEHKDRGGSESKMKTINSASTLSARGGGGGGGEETDADNDKASSTDSDNNNQPITLHGHTDADQSAGDLYSSHLTGHNGEGVAGAESDVFVLNNSQSDGDFIQADQSENETADPTAQHEQHLGVSSAGTVTSSLLMLLLTAVTAWL